MNALEIKNKITFFNIKSGKAVFDPQRICHMTLLCLLCKSTCKQPHRMTVKITIRMRKTYSAAYNFCNNKH